MKMSLGGVQLREWSAHEDSKQRNLKFLPEDHDVRTVELVYKAVYKAAMILELS